MIRILAIAALAVRTAIRSRLVVALIVLLVLSILVLPATVQGDGTLGGKLRVLLRYSLGLSSIILGLATLWTACGAVSQEIEDKQIQMLAVKPVPRFLLWLGKWIGLLALNAALLTVAGVATWGFVLWNARTAGGDERELQQVRQELLVGRRLVPARPLDVDREAVERFDQLQRAGAVPSQIARREALSLMKNQILAARSAVPPGASREWMFDLPDRQRAGGPMWLRVRFYSGFSMNKKPIAGTWHLGPGGLAPAHSVRMDDASDGVRQFLIPASVFTPGGAGVVRFDNASRTQSETVVFDRDQGVELLIPESGFGANLARALVVIWCQLALLAALGLSAGVLFSFPVAAFVSSSVLAIALMGHYFTFAASSDVTAEGHDHDHGVIEKPIQMQVIGERMGQQIDWITRPVLALNPLGSLSDGILVSWAFTGRAAGLLLILYPAVLWTLGGLGLRRRELAAG